MPTKSEQRRINVQQGRPVNDGLEPMTDRDRLIELLMATDECDGEKCTSPSKDCQVCLTEKIADYLLANGVIVPPCKVGDTVYTNTSMQGWYMRQKDRPYEAKIVFIGVNNVDNFMNVVLKNDNMLQFNFSQIGKTVFLTKEEAEQALQVYTSKELDYVEAKDLDKDSSEFKKALESLKRL